MRESHDPFTFLVHPDTADSGVSALLGGIVGQQGGGEAVWHRLIFGCGLALGLMLLGSPPANATDNRAMTTAQAGGTARGLRLPRFVSLKSDKVNVRRGPSTDQAIVWVFSRAGLPVEIIAESENWRRVRDSEGADGWVFHSLLSARRTVLVMPWSKNGERVLLYSSRSTSSRAVAELQAGVLGNVMSCDGEWCQLSVEDYSGYVQQEKLWGVYRGEEVK